MPEYPGIEYPPTFEPESYTLNLSHLNSRLISTDFIVKDDVRESSSLLFNNSSSDSAGQDQKNVCGTTLNPIDIMTQEDSDGYINIGPCPPVQSYPVGSKYKQNVYITQNYNTHTIERENKSIPMSSKDLSSGSFKNIPSNSTLTSHTKSKNRQDSTPKVVEPTLDCGTSATTRNGSPHCSALPVPQSGDLENEYIPMGNSPDMSSIVRTLSFSSSSKKTTSSAVSGGCYTTKTWIKSSPDDKGN